MKTKLAAGLGVIALLAAATLGTAPAAFADSTPATPTSTEVTSSPDTTPTPTPSTPPPATSESSSPSSPSAPSGVPPTATPATPPPASSSPKASSTPLLPSTSDTVTPSIAPSPPKTKTLSWLLGPGDTVAHPFVTPQTLYTTIVCGTGTIQNDVVLYDTPAHVATVDALIAKGTLAAPNGVPEDSTVYVSNVDTVQTPCVTPPPAAACKAATIDKSTWSTEDGAPTFTPNADGSVSGATYSTPLATSKVNYFGPASGQPLRGSTGSYTMTSSGGPQAAYDIEVYQNGTSGFATIVYEPYLNGYPLGGNGSKVTYTIGASSMVWNSKITSGPGSQAHPVTLTAMSDLIPNAKVIRAGNGQGRNNAATVSTVSAFTFDCAVTVFTSPPTPVVTPPVVAPPVVVPPPAPAPVAAAVAAPRVQRTALAFTGLDVTPYLEGGALLLLLGAIAVSVSTLRRRVRAEDATEV